MNEQERQEIRDRLELWEHVGKLQQVPDWQGKPFTPYAQYMEDIRRLLAEVELKESEYQATIKKLNDMSRAYRKIKTALENITKPIDDYQFKQLEYCITTAKKALEDAQ